MKGFTIGLDGGDEKVIANIVPIEEPGIMRYQIYVVYLPRERQDKGWAGVIEFDVDGWRQTAESLEKGPILPCSGRGDWRTD